MIRALFLFNHDSPHQVAHLAGVADAMARQFPSIEVIVAYGNEAIRERLLDFINSETATEVIWQELAMPEQSIRLSKVLDKLMPASRLLRLIGSKDLFEGVTVVISPERTCLQVKRFLRPERTPLFALLPHGAGDRSVSYHPDFRRFDLVLVAGAKVVDQLTSHGVRRDHIAVVGYPKFESVDIAFRKDFFSNGKPTFVYNPHFDPHLSSWYDEGPRLLRWFAGSEGQDFNLIFAPHVMLFRKSVHVSPEYLTVRRRPDIPAEALSAPNILIDVASPRLFDMTYMLAADAYIGDVSSQVYEFLVHPRPTFFLDTRRRARSGDDDRHLFWNSGPVARSAQDLIPLLADYTAIGDYYRPNQVSLFNYTFSTEELSASERAANAIMKVVSMWDRALPTP